MTNRGHNRAGLGILFGLAVWSRSSGAHADWAPGPPDCRDQGLHCDDAGLAAISTLERDHLCSCNPVLATGGPDQEDDEGCSCSAPGSSRSELPKAVLVLGLAAAGGALLRDRRR
jgi:MYXO-CTERM domain-containing protein